MPTLLSTGELTCSTSGATAAGQQAFLGTRNSSREQKIFQCLQSEEIHQMQLDPKFYEKCNIKQGDFFFSGKCEDINIMFHRKERMSVEGMH